MGSNKAVAEQVVVVGLALPGVSRTVAEEHLDELEKLVETAGGRVVSKIFQDRKSPDAATYVGRGKADEIRDIVQKLRAQLVIVDDDLAPAQARNLQEIIGVDVIDRSALILDIFARQARSRESRTQVELAQLNYMLPRLTRQWSHLSRQAGGIGTRGVGETQLELDRRMVRTRIAKLREELTRIEQTRETQRKGRKDVFTVALVGYTNAGKSTLFNRLTRGEAEAVDRLFATLDAKLQKAFFSAPRETVIIDTVGFIRKLPHHLVASFKSTMEEASSADLVLHVINSSHPQLDEQRQIGDEVLKDLGIEEARVVEVFNKADVVPTRFGRDGNRRVTVSALTGAGIDKLIEIIRERELAGGEVVHLAIPLDDSRTIARLYEIAQVYEARSAQTSTRFVAWIPSEALHQFDEFRVKAEPLQIAK